MRAAEIIFLGSKPIGSECFHYLLQQQGQLDFKVIGYLSKTKKEFAKNDSIDLLAKEYGIPKINSLDALPPCDLLYSVQYHKILKPQHIAKARRAALNLHMSPLPELRGSNQFSYAIIEERKIFGTTIHLMDDKIDHGPILFQQRFPIPEKCWVEDLYQMTYDASVKLFKTSLLNILSGAYKPHPQEKFEKRVGTALHFKSEAEELKNINLNWDVDKMERHIRATCMPGFEAPYCLINGHKAHFARKAHG